MFIPFTIVPTTAAGSPSRTATPPTVHWAHVDSGSMVCLVYEGVLKAYPELGEFRRPWRHEVVGIGGNRTSVVGKLVGVPISLGDRQDRGSVVRVTFYVLGGCDRYHWLLGLTLLQPIDAAIFCRSRILQYSLGPSRTPVALPC